MNVEPNATETLARAQFDTCYNELLYSLIQFQLLLPTPTQTPRLITPQEFIENVCSTQEQQDSILNEKTVFLKTIPFPTVIGPPLMIKPYKLYVTNPDYRRFLFEKLKHLYVHALHGPGLTGVAQRIQQNAANQQKQQHAAFLAQSQSAPTSSEEQTGSAGGSMQDVMNGFLPPEISETLSTEIQEIFQDPTMSTPSLNNPADLFQFAQNLMNNPRIIAICEKANEKMEQNGQSINEQGLENMANKGKEALNNLGPSAAMFAPMMANLFKNNGAAPDVDPNDPGIMDIVMRTLKEQKDKGRANDLGATMSIIARDVTVPKKIIDDDDIANLSPEQFAALQTLMQQQGGAMDIDFENDLDVD